MTARIHPTAIVEEGVEIGDGSAIWDAVHIRHGARIGRDCIVGEKSYIAYDVEIADLVKINAFVYICAGVTIERGAMISAGVIFTNDRYPRATDPELRALRGSEPDEHFLRTRVGRGVTLGAGAVIGCGLEIGDFAMVGMGSVVTRSVAPFTLVRGNPAAPAGIVCRCGPVLKTFDRGQQDEGPEILHCKACGRSYSILHGEVTEAAPQPARSTA